ncbi:MAG TPA: hypothetical protein VEL76_43090, partial [Gemmataceae bacterium]|nr:hypothetical protein [Gemmataceae bacterium]
MLLQLVKRLISSKRPSHRPSTRPRYRPRLEVLEDRRVPVVTFTVDTLGDLPDANVGDGDAEDVNGDTSLRAAIMEGNATNDSIVINFDPDLYPNNMPVTITLGSALPDLAKNFTITGPGSGVLWIQRDTNAQFSFRLLTITNDTLTCSIQGLTLAEGGGSDILYGGAILNDASLTLVDCGFYENQAAYGGAIFNDGTLPASACWFVGNVAQGNDARVGDGGAINSVGGTVTLTQGCSFSYNTAARFGGAIYIGATLVMRDNTQISSYNTALWGGGIYNVDGNVTMNGGSLAQNQANQAQGVDDSGRGGGYYGADGSASFTGVNFDTNSADNRGGGFYVAAGSLTIDTCTISGNMCSTGPGGYVQLNVTYNRVNCTVSDIIVIETM